MKIYIRVTNAFSFNPRTDFGASVLQPDAAAIAMANGRTFRGTPITSMDPAFITSMESSWPSTNELFGGSLPHGVLLADPKNNRFTDFRILNGSALLGQRLATQDLNFSAQGFDGWAYVNVPTLNTSGDIEAWKGKTDPNLLRRYDLNVLSYLTEVTPVTEYQQRQVGLLPTLKIIQSDAISDFYDRVVKWSFIAPDSSNSPTSQAVWTTLALAPIFSSFDASVANRLTLGTNVNNSACGFTLNLTIEIDDSLVQRGNSRTEDVYFIVPLDMITRAVFPATLNFVGASSQWLSDSFVNAPRILTVPLAAVIANQTATYFPVTTPTRNLGNALGALSAVWSGQMSSNVYFSTQRPFEDYIQPYISAFPTTPL